MPLQIDEDILVFCKNGKKVNYYPIKKKGSFRNKGGYNKKPLETMSGLSTNKISYNDDYYPINILEFTKERGFHPTQKPVSLFEYLIETYTKQNELVLDNCYGSGTTAIASHNLKRRFICIERDIDYFNASVERLKNIQAQMRLF